MAATFNDVAGAKFNYVIVGGGTSGLTLAARLAADPQSSVVVLEAGPMNLNDPKINVSGNLGQHLGNPKYDWMFSTAPQNHTNGRRHLWSRGKTLGGTSAINYFLWSKPPSCDIDAWEELGNPGWNWKRYMDASMRTEHFTPPSSDRNEWQSYYQSIFHGERGVLETSFARNFSEGDLVFMKTLDSLGINEAESILGGSPAGKSMSAVAISATKHTRSYSAQAFYLPNKDKKNLKVLCDASVHRLVTKSTSEGLVAEGVEFEYAGQLSTVFCTKEVIICAGTIKSPQILELSGIGDRAVLQPLGIETRIHLPGVGSNVQEHVCTSIVWEINPKSAFNTVDKLRNPIYAAEEMKLHPKGEGLFCLTLSSLAYLPLRTISSESTVDEIQAKFQQELAEKLPTLTPGQKEQYDIQLRFLKERNAECEYIFYPGYFLPTGPPDFNKCYASVIIATHHPFSRGTIHISSSNPRKQPDIDPHYLEEDIDREILAEAFYFARKMAETQPMKDIIAKELYPGAECKTAEDIEKYLRSSVTTFLHTVGSASMLPQEHNGVVDSSLRVYGTANVRVADLSIVPIHFCAHSQATAYAIAEIAADIIQSEDRDE